MNLKPILIVWLVLMSFPAAKAQSHYWESLILASDTFHYYQARSNLNDQSVTGWRSPGYDDSHWASGRAGIGFGDGDDSTEIPRGYSVYIRKKFILRDTSKIQQLLLLLDYDDGFVAYLNGTEVARANMDPQDTYPPFNSLAQSSHEARMYQGGYPSIFAVPSTVFQTAATEGENLLALQVHNNRSNSNDLSAIPYLIATRNQPDTQARPVPAWFNQMLEQAASDLPLVCIETGGAAIRDDPRIRARMSIINCPGEGVIYPFDPPTDYNGWINIEKRGHSSQFLFPDGKISYALETQDSTGENNNVSPLGFPKENDWILYAPYSDKTLIRNVLVYHFGPKAGLSAPRTKYCNLVINGEPQGLYVWTEKIKRDKNRVDISKLRDVDLEGDQLTGGYIIKVDWPNNVPNEGWTSPYPPNNGTGQQTVFVMQYPKPDKIQPEQLNYIREYVTEFETVLRSENFLDPDEGYRKYINFQSWVDFFLISELFRDTDAYRCSVFMYKDRDSRGGKLTMGPLWDYNYSMGNYENFNVFSTEGWAYLFNYDCNTRAKINPFWYERIMEDEDFRNRARTRWDELRQGALHTDSIMNFINQTVARIRHSADRNFEIWPVLNTYLWPNYYVGGTYENEISWLKNWLTERAAWIDAHLPGQGSSGANPLLSSGRPFIYVFPNPFHDELNIQIDQPDTGQPLLIEILDLNGKTVATLHPGERSYGIQTIKWTGSGAIPPGVYLVAAFREGRSIGVRRVVKR